MTPANHGSTGTICGSRSLDRAVFWVLFLILLALSTRLEVYARP